MNCFHRVAPRISNEWIKPFFAMRFATYEATFMPIPVPGWHQGLKLHENNGKRFLLDSTPTLFTLP
jgi:hypothetical protein